MRVAFVVEGCRRQQPTRVCSSALRVPLRSRRLGQQACGSVDDVTQVLRCTSFHLAGPGLLFVFGEQGKTCVSDHESTRMLPKLQKQRPTIVPGVLPRTAGGNCGPQHATRTFLKHAIIARNSFSHTPLSSTSSFAMRHLPNAAISRGQSLRMVLNTRPTREPPPPPPVGSILRCATDRAERESRRPRRFAHRRPENAPESANQLSL